MSIINHTPLNPNGYQLMKYTHDKDVRFILMYGGSSSGKSFGAAEVFIMLTFEDGENSVVFRKVGATIKDSIYEDFKVASDTLVVKEQLRFLQNCIRFPNGARIDFKGLDESERIKGISNYKRVLLEELSEFEENDFKQIRKRLRGKEGQQIIGDWNPISEEHWIKKKVIDKEDWHDVPMTVELIDKDGRLRPLKPWRTEVKSIKMNSSRDIVNVRTGEITTIPPNMVLIQTTYLNNFWVVGSPNGKFGFYDEQAVADFEHDKVHDPDYYRIYALGEWGVLHTGSEFFWAYNTSKHLKQVPFIPELPVHLSVDNNVLPYITNTLWQVEETPEKVRVRQFAEVMATSPDNTVKKAARLVAKRLRSLNYAEKVILHGDASTRAANTIDEEKRSFLDLYISTLNEEGFEVEDCVDKSNPSVPMTGEFINQLLDGADANVEIEIDESCKVSSDDYLMVQKDVNGGILKTRVKNKMTGQTYEEHGHAADSFRYLIFDVLRSKFVEFANRRKRNIYAKDDALSFFNGETAYEYAASLAYVMPNVGGVFVMVHGSLVGREWHIVNVFFRESVSTEEITHAVMEEDVDYCVFECPDAYFGYVRDLRKRTSRNIKVMGEVSDVDRRIAATSDFVKEHVRFSPGKRNETEYDAFLTNMLDYNPKQEGKQASAAISGFAQYVMTKYPMG